MRARRHELRDAELLDAPKALEFRRVKQRPSELVQLVAFAKHDNAMDRIPDAVGAGHGWNITRTCREGCLRIEPMMEQLKALPDELGQVETLLADNGYFSAANVMACEAANIVPLIATGREVHHPSLAERFAAVPTAPQDPTPVQSMAHRLKTAEGKKLYALRKQVPEPVFGIIKSVLGFRQFLLRGLDCVRGEWSLVTMAWNMKRMFALCPTI